MMKQVDEHDHHHGAFMLWMNRGGVKGGYS